MKTAETVEEQDVMETLRELSRNLPLFAERYLMVRTKADGMKPLRFNAAQMQLHARLEAQKRETGRVRALALKGRQMGISTYIAARYFHQTTFNCGVRTFILTHEQKATDNLFEIVERFHQNLPEALKHKLSAANKKELEFEGMDSGYRVGTAGKKEQGRSLTIQKFHGSEIAFWPNAENHLSGVMQAVPEASGTEIVYESTANGYDAVFHPKVSQAIKGVGDYILVFLPWYIDAGYNRPEPVGFVMSEEDEEYRVAHGLTMEQMAFRHAKIMELKGKHSYEYGMAKFRQEYPANPSEAFQTTGHEPFLPAEMVKEAQKRENEPGNTLMIGMDPAISEDGDRAVMVCRSAGHVFPIKTFRGKDTSQLAGIIAKEFDEHRGDYQKIGIRVDRVGLGEGVVAALRERGYGKYTIGVYGGSTAIDDDNYPDRRSEQAAHFLEYLTSGGDLPGEEPSNEREATPEDILKDCVALGREDDDKHILRLESKKRAKQRRAIESPDIFDAICLTFDTPVKAQHQKKETRVDQYIKKRGRRQSRAGKSYMSA